MSIHNSDIADGGPLYSETLDHLHSGSDHWLVEPYNAASAVLFVLIAVYWLWRLWGQFSEQKFLLYGLVLLTIGGVGGTLYHALRTEPIYLLMDWGPIMLLILSLTYWFMLKLTRTRWLSLAYTAGGFLAVLFTFQVLATVFRPGPATASIGYSLAALQAVGPIVYYIFRTRFKHSAWFFSGIAAFALAAVFRATDHSGLLPMGTHFLWHTFGAIMSWLLLEFIYRVERDDPLTIKAKLTGQVVVERVGAQSG